MPRPSKRSALDTLTKARLLELDRGFEVGTPQNRPKAEFVDALASSKKASFEKVLGLLSRDELKDICRTHALDDSGGCALERCLGGRSSITGFSSCR